MQVSPSTRHGAAHGPTEQLHAFDATLLGRRSARGVTSATAAAWVLLLAGIVTVALQSLRVLFPVAYSYRERAGLQPTVLLLLVVFATPVLAPLLVRIAQPRVALLTAVGALGALRLLVQFSGTVEVWLTATTVAVAMLALAVALLTVDAPGWSAALGVVAGLSLDTMLRGVWSTWDFAWRPDVAAAAVAVALVAALAAAALLAAARHTGPPLRASARAPLVLGPYLFVQVLFLQSPAFVASSAGVALATAVAVVLVGDVLALLTVWWLSTCRLPSLATVGGAVAVAVMSWFLSASTGAPVVVLLLASQVLATGLVTYAMRPSETSPFLSGTRAAASAAAGSLVLGILVLLYQAHYENPLPISNRWLPVVAVAILGVAAMRRRLEGVGGSALARVTVSTASVMIVGAVALCTGLVWTQPSLAAEPRPAALRLVTYNPHETVTRHGQLDPEAMARVVAPLHPDLVAVEETGRGWALSGTLDLGEWAKRRLGLPYTWGPAADQQFGTALFSRVPVLDARVVPLPPAAGQMKRSAIIAHVGPVSGHVVTVIAAHLQDGHTESRKQTRVDELRVLLREWNGAPHTVLMGDLNSDPGSREIATILNAGFTTTQPTGTCTLKTSNRNCVDWIFVTRDFAQSTVRAIPYDVFDHRPLVDWVKPL